MNNLLLYVLKNNIELILIKKSDHLFLYDLLKNRKVIENISHKKMPTYKQHVQFINTKPYSKWYIIFCQKEKIGTAYLSRLNEIGIHLINSVIEKKLNKEIISKMMEKNDKDRYLINVGIKNKKLSKLVEFYGFSKIQTTFEINSKRLK
jgi:hypothetical protein